MLVRFELSVVPPLNTFTGEPDCVDVADLECLGFTGVTKRYLVPG